MIHIEETKRINYQGIEKRELRRILETLQVHYESTD